MKTHDESAGTAVPMCAIHVTSDSFCPWQHHVWSMCCAAPHLCPPLSCQQPFTTCGRGCEVRGRDGAPAGLGRAAEPCAKKLFRLVIVRCWHRIRHV